MLSNQVLDAGFELHGITTQPNAQTNREEYRLDIARVREALAFYQAHHVEVDFSIQAERELEPNRE